MCQKLLNTDNYKVGSIPNSAKPAINLALNKDVPESTIICDLKGLSFNQEVLIMLLG